MIHRYPRQALADLDQARSYIALDRPAAARAVVARIREAIDVLRRFPEIGRQGRVVGTRELAITGTPFLVAYRIAGKEIWILAIIHGARRWPSSF